jgi:hypothetical protein
VPAGKLKEKKLKNNFFCTLKVTEERESDSELDPDPDPLARGTGPGSGSAPKYHGSPTLI